MVTIKELLKLALQQKASDLHITVKSAPVLRVSGTFRYFKTAPLTPEDTEQMCRDILDENNWQKLQKLGEVDVAVALGENRFRVNAFRQKGCYAIAIRTINSVIPSFPALGLPNTMLDLCNKSRGIILVTGPTGSGKSTTLASMIDYINNHRSAHIITLEDPIEYYHNHIKSIVNQREIGNDTRSFAAALRASLRQDPDVIQVGEMRDLETISTAITAAETGHLVMSTLHTIGAANTVDRMVDVFPTYQQQQVRLQLSMVLQAVISQQLIPKADGTGRVCALEIMLNHPAISALIREGKTHQIANTIMTNRNSGMMLMDDSIANYLRQGIITQEKAILYSVDPDYMLAQAKKG
ncbi:MAG: type IV pilus twitching motility protein PilT [Clostridia bacterium]|nr:type IV pilus twitching motility protein PilT [Clostridia bacterium]